MCPGEVVLEIPATSAMVSTARLVVACLAGTRRELSADRVDDLKLAVSEACSNAVEAYGAAHSGQERVSVSWAEDDDALTVRVTDHGRGYDPDSGDPDGAGGVDPGDGSPVGSTGLGVGLIRALVDKSAFTSASPGTTVELTMHCPRADAEGS